MTQRSYGRLGLAMIKLCGDSRARTGTGVPDCAARLTTAQAAESQVSMGRGQARRSSKWLSNSSSFFEQEGGPQVWWPVGALLIGSCVATRTGIASRMSAYSRRSCRSRAPAWAVWVHRARRGTCERYGLATPPRRPSASPQPTHRCLAELSDRVRVARALGMSRRTYVCPRVAMQLASQLIRAWHHASARERPREIYTSVCCGRIISARLN
jgi:hypothetical protein